MRKQTKLAVMLASVALLVVSAASIVSARGWVQQGGNWYYEKSDGEFATDEIQTSGTSKFYLGEDGTMQTDYFLEDFGDGNNTYYFGSNGAMVTNTWVAIDPSIVSNQGDIVPAVYWYYFGSTGKATRASSGATGNVKKTTIDGKKYAFNENGQMLTGWIDSSGAVIDPDEDDPFASAVYYAGDENDGQLHSGWLTFLDGTTDSTFEDRNVLYFYFNPTNNIKLGKNSDLVDDHDTDKQYKTKKINGRTYAFQEGTGIMLSGWDAYNIASTDKIYFSAEDDGHQVKKGWVYAVPAREMDEDAYNDDEEKYMYFLNNGDMVTNQIKKINGKYYAFDGNGIMKTGLLMFKQNGEFAKKIDFDDTDGAKLTKQGIINSAKTAETLTVADNGDITYDGNIVKIHLFGTDGARRTGSTTITFSDDDYTFGSNNNGNFQGLNKKKYYNLGILMKASSDLRYGLYIPTPSEAMAAQTYAGHAPFWVLNTSGGKVDGSNTAKKDADGNFWLINKDTDTLVGIYTVEVKWNPSASAGVAAGHYEFKAESFTDTANVFGGNVGTNIKTYSNKWIPFGMNDDSGKTCSENYGEGNYQVTPNADYALNFTWN